MSTIVQTKGSKTIRIITRSKPIPKVHKPIELRGQSSNYQKAMKYGVSIFEERIVHTADGANKVFKSCVKRALHKKGEYLLLPMPCWKSFDKRRKQWKKVGHPSVRTLNDTGRCIFPSVIV